MFMGTPEFAAVSLEALIKNGEDVACVISQPYKPKNRGMKLVPTAVGAVAEKNSILLKTPETLKDKAILPLLSEVEPDLIAVVAYGKLLPQYVLDFPKYGCINIHGSLLPKYRGAAPIQWAVLNGDRVTGVSTMYLASEMDTGDIIYTAETEIGEFETSGELFDRLKVMGAELLVKTLRDIETGTAPRTPQDHACASYVKMLDKSDSPIDWTRDARGVIKWIYGLQPWPVATAELDGAVYKIFAAEYTKTRTDSAPGTVVSTGKAGIEVACGGGETVMITQLQAPGKKRMSAADFLRGHTIKLGV